MRPRLPLPDADDVPVVVAARLSLSSRCSSARFHCGRSTAPSATRSRSGAGSRTEASRATSRSTSSTHLCRSARRSESISTASTPITPGSPTRAGTCGLPGVAATPVLQNWHRFRPGEGVGVLADFANGLVRTMQNHADTALAHQPGYRERIVHVHHQRNEGGLNLDMPPEVVLALTRRGREAGRVLVREFGSGRRRRRGRAIAGCATAPRSRRSRSSRRASTPPGTPSPSASRRTAGSSSGRPASHRRSIRWMRRSARSPSPSPTGSPPPARLHATPARWSWARPGSPQPEPRARIVPRD